MRKVAIVTGGARGIGRACALALARAGYDIALVDLLAPELERTANEIRMLDRQAMTFELGPTILVNAICPGLIQTEIPKNPVIVERGAEIARDGIALRRVGGTDDVAQLVLFLATSEPCFITGQDFTVDGFQYNI